MAWSKEKHAEYLKKWIANNREKWNGYQRKYYRKKRGNAVIDLQNLNIGEAIRKARLDKGYSILKMAEIAQVTFNTVYRWEKGISYPNVFNLIPIADALGVTLDELVGRTVKADERN
jgi:predicted transcriptional regulator